MKLNDVKQDPESGTVAQCVDPDSEKPWLVLGFNQHRVASVDIEHWNDLTP